VVLEDRRDVDDFALRIHMDHFQVFPRGDAALPKALEHAVRAKIARDVGAIVTITALKLRSAASVLAFAGEAEEVL